MHLALASGPWGSETSTVTGPLKHLSVRTPKPYFVITDDPRTPITYEKRQFGDTVLEAAEEHTLRKKKSSSCIKDSLHRFRESIKTELHLTDESRIIAKTSTFSNYPRRNKRGFSDSIDSLIEANRGDGEITAKAKVASALRRNWGAHYLCRINRAYRKQGSLLIRNDSL